GCISLVEVEFDEGLEIIGERAFSECIKLARLQFSEGLEIIGERAFKECTAVQSVTVPSSVTKLGSNAFTGCTNLTELILLGGERLLNQGFLDRGLPSNKGVLNHRRFNRWMGGRWNFSFYGCPLTAVKISVTGTISKRMTRLTRGCRLSVEGRVHDLRQLELTQDGNILACFPLVTRAPDNVQDTILVEDTDNQTAQSLHQLLRLISFHELKESSILFELAMWKSRLDERRARADCRISVPDPAKSLIMEYCGFVRFLEPAIEGD
ncbi:hypothetical protein THAOC_17593, partial [Thalassiosira oceanica]